MPETLPGRAGRERAGRRLAVRGGAGVWLWGTRGPGGSGTGWSHGGGPAGARKSCRRQVWELFGLGVGWPVLGPGRGESGCPHAEGGPGLGAAQGARAPTGPVSLPLSGGRPTLLVQVGDHPVALGRPLPLPRPHPVTPGVQRGLPILAASGVFWELPVRRPRSTGHGVLARLPGRVGAGPAGPGGAAPRAPEGGRLRARERACLRWTEGTAAQSQEGSQGTSARGERRGSADKWCSASGLPPTPRPPPLQPLLEPRAASPPPPPQARRRAHSHTCANIRPPAGKTAPLCPAWHRCPGLAVSCSSSPGGRGPGRAIVPARPRAALGPRHPGLGANGSHSQRPLPLQLSGRPPRLELWAVLLARRGQTALQKPKPGSSAGAFRLCASAAEPLLSGGCLCPGSVRPPWARAPPLPLPRPVTPGASPQWTAAQPAGPFLVCPPGRPAPRPAALRRGGHTRSRAARPLEGEASTAPPLEPRGAACADTRVPGGLWVLWGGPSPLRQAGRRLWRQ